MKEKSKSFNTYLIGSKCKYSAILFLKSLDVVMETGTALIYGELVNQVSRGTEIKTLILNICLTLVYSIVTSLLKWICMHQEETYLQKTLYRIRNDYFSRIVNAKYTYISSNDSSKYISNIQNDIPKVVYTFVGESIWGVGSVIMVISSLVASIILNWKIALTMLTFTVIMAILPLFIKKPLDRSSVERSKKEMSFMGILKENFLGVSIIKGFSAEKIAVNKVKENHDELLKSQNKNNFINQCAGGLGSLVREISIVALIGITCFFVYKKEVEVGAVLSIFSIGLRFYGGILNCSAIVTEMGGVKSLKNLLKEVFEIENSPEPIEKVEFEKSIKIKNLSFSYKENDRKILNNINLEFEKNKKYLILGKSGSGKSTLLKILSKYYDQYDGAICLDDTDYTSFSEKEITTIIAISQQDCYLFNTSLKNNIDFLREGNSEKFDWVMKKTVLTDFTETLPNGIDSEIDEEVNQVSGRRKIKNQFGKSVL